MNLTPEMKAQLQEQKKQCVFCKLISGEMEAKKVFEDDLTISMVDIHPAIKGHITFMPKEHYPILPYLSQEEFKHLFGIIPQLCQAVKEAMVTTSINVFIANGGAAGQQAGHFLMHLLPRENGDGFFNFFWKPKETLEEEKLKILQNNFPIMMGNHFKRNPMSWHTGTGEMVSYLQDVYANEIILYEDEQALVVMPKKGVVKGHIQVYSKIEEKLIENLSIDEAFHLFSTASLAATLVFEGLGVHGTNIILKSGETDDNPDGKLCINILPRMAEDGLNNSLLWQPKEPSYDLDSVKSRIKDKTWKVKYKEEKKKVEETVVESKVIKIGSEEKKSNNGVDEIKEAIERINN
ncbi:HIT domain-containing protein [Candidatus Woesearchaeota archaeon]|mgnify:CR=1 FL=1|jgi:histidine triad (HIT) family protein|nr:HIT domain-containing protein [Candidatus Woesearchaeota archaeon]